MSKVLITESHLEDIADAIRDKNGTETTYRPGDMAEAISEIDTKNPMQGEVTPQLYEQTLVPTEPYDCFDEIHVGAVTSSIDPVNIVASNIKEGATILGVDGEVVEANHTTRTINPSTLQQTITPTGNYNGFSSVTVNAVTSSIDSDIQPNNIKKDVNILGVVGTYDPEFTTQEKTATPTKSTQNIVADAGYDGLSKVTINPIPSQYIIPSGTKTVNENGVTDVTQYANVNVDVQPEIDIVDLTVNPSKTRQVFTHDGHTGYDTVTVNGYTVNLQSKTLTELTRQSQTITYGSGYDGLSSVIVPGIPSEYIIPEGAYVATSDGEYDIAQYRNVRVMVNSSEIDTETIIENFNKNKYFTSNDLFVGNNCVWYVFEYIDMYTIDRPSEASSQAYFEYVISDDASQYARKYIWLNIATGDNEGLHPTSYITYQIDGVNQASPITTYGGSIQLPTGISGKMRLLIGIGLDTNIAEFSKNNKVIIYGGTLELQDNKEVTPTKELQNVYPDVGYDAMKKVTVNPIKLANLELVTKIHNGTYDFFIPEGFDGFDEFQLEVDIQMEEKSIDITENGLKFCYPDDGYDGLRYAAINVNVESEPTLQDKSVTITTNTETTITSDAGYDGLGTVTVTTNVESETILQDKSVTITSNTETTITADTGYDGLGTVTVTTNIDVPYLIYDNEWKVA